MKLRENITADKLRGGFYSPTSLVTVCLDRIAELTEGREGLSVLEPSAGDGSFLRTLQAHRLSEHVESVLAVELSESEAAKCSGTLANATYDGQVIHGSFIPWCLEAERQFDVAIGNPPYVRYQFVDPEDKVLISEIGQRLGLKLGGVSNLWIPVLLGALSCLKEGGAFAFIIPAEVFTGVSAGAVRTWLTSNVESIRTDIFPPGSFPGVLQEIVILSGRRRPSVHPGPPYLEVQEHTSEGKRSRWLALIHPQVQTWTRYLLNPAQLQAFDEARQIEVVSSLSEVAKFEVSIVTGANEYFSVDEATMNAYGLHPWAKPLLPRVRHATGLRFLQEDYSEMTQQGVKAKILHFAENLPDPRESPEAADYLAAGEAEGLPSRYKCSIRKPWYRVPHVRSGRLMLSKRCHLYPRVILNEAGAYTTDTIYRGDMKPRYVENIADFVTAFHNSLTVLSAEIEGRSFGGGVLELVPSEINRLAVPMIPGMAKHLNHLDAVLRASQDPEASDDLIEETDRLLVAADLGFSRPLLDKLNEARQSLLSRRLARN